LIISYKINHSDCFT